MGLEYLLLFSYPKWCLLITESEKHDRDWSITGKIYAARGERRGHQGAESLQLQLFRSFAANNWPNRIESTADVADLSKVGRPLNRYLPLQRRARRQCPLMAAKGSSDRCWTTERNSWLQCYTKQAR